MNFFWDLEREKNNNDYRKKKLKNSNKVIIIFVTQFIIIKWPNHRKSKSSREDPTKIKEEILHRQNLTNEFLRNKNVNCINKLKISQSKRKKQLR